MDRVHRKDSINAFRRERKRADIALNSWIPVGICLCKHRLTGIENNSFRGDSPTSPTGSTTEINDLLDGTSGPSETVFEGFRIGFREEQIVEGRKSVEVRNVVHTRIEGTNPYESRVNGEMMEYVVLGMPADGPTLTLDWETFSYAGKFEMSSTGKAVLCDQNEIVAAAAFNEDRATENHAWIRYLTVRSDRQGEGLGSQLATSVTKTLIDRGYEQVTIAVNNPRAYRALYKAGFHFTGRETGIAELVLKFPGPRPPAAYREGLERFAERDLPGNDERLVGVWLENGTPPQTVNGIPMAPSAKAEDNGAC